MEISVGIKVAARGLEWDVTEVQPLGAQQRVVLACCGGDLAGLEWEILYPAEALTILDRNPRPEEATALDAWRRYHIARLLEQIPGAPAAPGRVAIEAYQRVPLLRALDMVRPRLLLADGVGLGKTIQAGLIAAELLVRRRAHRILVVCPPGPLLRQWEQEMRVRFGLRFTPISDAASLREARRGLELGANPFEAVALCLTSMDFAKSDRILAELERVCWDLVIIDEAHHCVGEENQRRGLAEVVAAKSDGLLLLTATPHDGHDEHFAALLALLDPSLVDGAGRLIGTGYRRHVVRRLKSHIRSASGMPLFRERVVIPVPVDVSDAAPVGDFHKALSALVAPRLRRSRDRGGLTDALAFVSLLKRSMSSIAACLATLRVVADRYGTKPQRERRRALQAYRQRMARFGVLGPAEEEDIAELEAEEMAASLAGERVGDELRALIRLGEAAAPHDPKLAALVLEIRLIRLRHPDANVLVYTEYTDSQDAAVLRLAEIGGTILTISGADSESERSRVAERFAEADGIVLVSTDSLAEGLNLHRRCFHLIHLDLPYNPNRLEQRNGRIDRYGQRIDPEIRYLFLAGTFEERLLLRLIAKYEKARACLSFMPNTLGVGADPARLQEPLLQGFAEDLFSATPRLVHSLDLLAEEARGDAYRDLLREIDRAFQSFDLMAVRHGWLSGAEAADADVAAAVTAGPDATSVTTGGSTSPGSGTTSPAVGGSASVTTGGSGATSVAAAGLAANLPTATGIGAASPASGGSRAGSVATAGADAVWTDAAGAIDVPDFVASVLAPGTDGFRIPAGWADDLDGLPGFDRTTGTVRLTGDPDRLRDERGRELMYPGRSHPLTRRAIASVRAGRVSAAHAEALSLLVTYVVEVGTHFRRVFAVRLFPDGPSAEQIDFLSLAERPLLEADTRVAEANPWDRLFAGWAPDAITAADPLVTAIGERMATDFAALHRARQQQEAAVAAAWLQRRSNDICGPVLPWMGDLFDNAPPSGEWPFCRDPEQRLSGLVADAMVHVPRRREAAGVLSRFRAITAAAATPLPPRSIRMLGLLMLTP